MESRLERKGGSHWGEGHELPQDPPACGGLGQRSRAVLQTGWTGGGQLGCGGDSQQMSEGCPPRVAMERKKQVGQRQSHGLKHRKMRQGAADRPG